MKKPIFFCSLLLLSATAFAQTLFTVGGERVSTEAFKKAFKKNNPTDSSVQAMQDYLKLYIRYKLKVKAAIAKGIDTLPAQHQEAEQFRSQIAEPYMLDGARIQSLTEEAIDRAKTDVLAAQIFIPFDKDETTALAQINEAHNMLKKGTPFQDVAAKFPSNNGTQKNGRIGWVTAFTLPYTPESVLYELKPGTFSAPLKSSAGYHIFRKEAVRPNPGQLSVAHILLTFPPEATAKDSASVLKKADSVYNELLKGKSFADMAKAVSDDNGSFQMGGELAPFTTGENDEVFENAAFALAKDGDISKPVLTAYGYHIIKRMKLIPRSVISTDPLYVESIRQQIYQDSRSEQARDALIDMVIKKAGSRLLVPEKDLFDFSEKNLQTDTIVPYNKISTRTPVLATGSRTMDALEWCRYIRVARNPLNNQEKPKSYPELLETMRRYEAMQYYRDHLEEFQPAFAEQFREFKEGNMLFEIMQQEVWNKSSADSAGLSRFYQQNKDKYFWEPSAEAVLLTCTDQMAAGELKRKITANPALWQQITDAMEGRATADSAKMELTQLPISGNTALKEKNFTEQVLQADGTVLFAYIFKLYPEKHPRSFEEARGFVLNDYQQFLEDEWVKKLEKVYPVTMHEKERKQLFGNAGK